MRYRGKPPIIDIIALVLLALELLVLSFALGANWAKAVEPEPAPVARSVVVKDDGRLPGDDVPATETAVWNGPELVSLGEFKITHYCPCPICCGEWADGITYTGTQATEGRTVAVDPTVIPSGSDVLLRYADGTEAIFTAEDCGGAIKSKRIDVFMDSHQAALVEGVKYAEV